MLTHLELDDTAASQVEAALQALHDGRNTAAADAYLRSVQATPGSSLRLAYSILANPEKASSPALHFAASCLQQHASHELKNAATVARHALIHRKCAQEEATAARLCAAVATDIVTNALSAASRSVEPVLLQSVQANFARSAAELRTAAASSTPGNECLADETVARAASNQTTVDPNCHFLLHFLCSTEALAVQQRAVHVLFDAESTAKLRCSAVACIRAWVPYTNDLMSSVIDPLVRALAVLPDLASDLSFAIGDAIETLGTRPNSSFAPAQLRPVIGALSQSYDTASTTHPPHHAEQVCHATSEIMVSVADTFADLLMERDIDDQEATFTVSEITALMSVCVQNRNHATFEASLSCWDTWIASASMVPVQSNRIVVAALPDVVRAIVAHIGATQTAADDAVLGGDDDDQMVHRLRNAAVDTLHQAAQILSVAEYLNVLQHSMHEEAALFALAAASDVACSDNDTLAVAKVLPHLISMSSADAVQVSQSVRRSAFRALGAFAHILVSPAVGDDVLHAALLQACKSLRVLGLEPAMFLQEAAGADAKRLLPFLSQLLDYAQHAFSGSSLLMLRPRQDVETFHGKDLNAPELVVHALALIGAELPSTAMREEFMQRIIQEPVQNILSRKSDERNNDDSVWNDCQADSRMNTVFGNLLALTCRDLRLVSVAMRGINDCSVCAHIIQSLYGPLADLCHQHAANPAVASVVCQIFEASAGPTFVDPGENRSRAPDLQLGGHERCHLIVSCISLASTGFAASGPTGDSCWLFTIASLTTQLLPMRDFETLATIDACMALSMQKARQCVVQFTTGSEMVSRPDMLRAMLRFQDVLLNDRNDAAHRNAVRVMSAPAVSLALLKEANGCAEVALAALRINDSAVVTAALTWWSRLLKNESAQQFASEVVRVSGGACMLHSQLVASVCAQSGTRKIVYLAADALLSLHRWTGGQLVPSLDNLAMSETDKHIIQAALSSSTRHDNARVLRACLADVARVVRCEIAASTLSSYVDRTVT